MVERASLSTGNAATLPKAPEDDWAPRGGRAAQEPQEVLSDKPQPSSSLWKSTSAEVGADFSDFCSTSESYGLSDLCGWNGVVEFHSRSP